MKWRGIVLLTLISLAARGQTVISVDDPAAWRPMRGSAAVTAATIDGRKGLRMPCGFAAGEIERASWDRKVRLDLSSSQGVEFDFLTSNSAPVSHYSIYFQSGGGWYSATFFPEATGRWETIAIDKAATRSEGKPEGWGSIQTIRISAWRGRSQDTEFYLGRMRATGALGIDASIAIVRADEYGEAVATMFAKSGLRTVTVSENEITAAQLGKAKLLVLPNNPVLPDRAAAEILAYLRHGGKLLAFYNLPQQLRAAVKIDVGKHVKADFSAIRFNDGALPGAPTQVAQHSWNIMEAKGKVLAEWLDDKGQPTGKAAVVASANCILMTHVLLKDDPLNKSRMLMAMAGSLAPELWKQSVNEALARAGRIGPAKNFDEAARLISPAGAKAVRKMLDDAKSQASKGKYAQASEAASAASGRLMTEFAKSRKPLKGEFRAFWCHNAFGVDGMDWDEAIRQLAANGFTAILPNMLWGGAAFYDSKVLPVAAEADQIAKAVAAGKKYGVEVHVWKVNWNLGRAVPPAFLEKMRREGRLQMSASGKEEPWLCPSHPENRKLEIASTVEVARNYDVSGIHFDYIRYPDHNHCFCQGCRTRFAQAAGVKIERWPQDVTEGPLRQKWLDWRRSNITAVVAAVSEQARAAKPGIKISAAVFRNWEVDRDGVGQDWKLWCEKGYLDFVCPMDYTNSDRQFENWVSAQKDWAGKTPVYPGIGESASSSRLTADRVMGQIEIARKHNTNGFVIFNYAVPEAKELLPLLGLGITAKR